MTYSLKATAALSLMTLATFAAAPNVYSQTPPVAQCLSYEDALSLSAQRDPNVAIARAAETEADAGIKDARSLFRPQVSAFARSGFGDTGVTDTSVSNQVGLRASQRVLDFGDAKFARRAAKATYAASQDDTRQAQNQAALEAGLAYLAYNEASAQAALTSTRQTYFADLLSATDTLLQTGAATRTQRAAVASQLADAQAFVQELDFRRERAQTQLQIAIGVETALCQLSDATESIFADYPDVDAAIDAALLKSPSIKSLKQQADSSDATRKREARARLPVIDVVATGAYSSNSGFDQFDFRDRIGVDVSVPIYSGNALGARTQRAAAQYSAAKGRLANAKQQLTEDVSITFRRMVSLQAQLLSRKEVEAQAKLQFEAAQSEQAAGTQTFRELIEIRLEYEQAGLSAIATAFDLERQVLSLKFLTANLL